MRNPEREVHYFRLRVLVAMAFVILCFTLLGARFAWLQVVKHEAYLAQAEINRIAVVPVAPNRGLIKGRWVEKAGERPRCYYKLTADGRRVLAEQRRTWRAYIAAINEVMGTGDA